ncbi:TetR/AcrR family transcriptional regulator [Tumebacillus lipolyticus]|uniref:TetR/AcrR family transcriptional regulator n=1 Tax=Tumebacillus lipolyticus TaxID=1280370 RepID=A0ABW4ZZ26_9BACL
MVTKHEIKTAQTIEKLKKAAFELFAQKGYAVTSVNDITQAAGYSKGAYYSHFSNKEEIFLLIMEERMIEQHQRITHFLGEDPVEAQNVEQLLYEIFQYIFQMALDQYWVPMFIEFIANSNRSEKVQAGLTQMYINWRQVIEQLLLDLETRKLIRPKLPISVLAVTIIAMFDGYNIQSHVDKDTDPTQQFMVVRELLF